MASILNQTTAEADARLVRYTGDPARTADATESGAILVRSWPYVAVSSSTAGTIHSLVIALNAVATYGPTTPPKADRVEYTGTWINSKVTADDENQDGLGDRAGVIIQTLTRVLSPSTASDLAGLDAIISQENEILNIFETNKGERDLITYTYKNLNPAQRVTLMAIADADLVTSLASTYTYEDRKFVENEDRTGTFVVLFRITNFGVSTAINTIAAEYTRYTPNYGRGEVTESVTWVNINAATATNVYNDAIAQAANTAASTYKASPASHKLKSVDRIPQGEGRYRVERVTFIPRSTGGETNWPPADDTWQVPFVKRRYRKYVEPETGYATNEVRTWAYVKAVKYTATASAADSQLATWAGANTLEQGSGVSTAGNNLQWQAVGIWMTSAGSWATE